MCAISKVNGENDGKQIYLANKEYIEDYRCERGNMAAKYKIDWDYYLNLHSN